MDALHFLAQTLTGKLSTRMDQLLSHTLKSKQNKRYRKMINFSDNYLMTFSKNSLRPPMKSSRNAQFTNPVKLSNPDVHVKSESLGL